VFVFPLKAPEPGRFGASDPLSGSAVPEVGQPCRTRQARR